MSKNSVFFLPNLVAVVTSEQESLQDITWPKNVLRSFCLAFSDSDQ